ncbi:MAG: type II toxin-antitoxin system VapC family toxin [Verrucomicrobia bacterium]|nr:type II toxin-antitoxin system VapC family toxin [Verrucomicrobiota bacterium]
MTLVDSHVILDLVTADKRWLEWSSGRPEQVADSGPVAINPVVFAECAHGYADIADLGSDLPARMKMLPLTYEAAFLAGKAFARYRRLGGTRERILGDFYVSAHAQTAGLTLLTRNATRYRACFPTVKLIAPD